MSNKRIPDEVAVIRQTPVTFKMTVTPKDEKVEDDETMTITYDEVDDEVEDKPEIEVVDTSKPYCLRCNDNTSLMGLGTYENTDEWNIVGAECLSCGNRFSIKMYHDSDKWEFTE